MSALMVAVRTTVSDSSLPVASHLFRVLFDTLPDLDGARSRHGLFIDGMERLPCRFTPTRAGSAYDRVFTLPVTAPVALRTT